LATERIYYFEAHRTEFDAEVLDIRKDDGKLLVTLDRTAFYPTGGGQPHDTGLLDEVPVVDVVEGEDDQVVHVLEGAASFMLGARVHGRVNAQRRLDHLQQHSGQHLLSAAFMRVADAATLSFHLGAETSTIDLALTEDVEQSVRDAVDLANRIIFEDRPLTVQVVTEEEARRLPLRKEVPVQGDVRVVSIQDFDASPCGGTHARHTGEIRMVAVLGAERYKKGTRMEFVAGERVHRTLMAMNAEVEAVGGLISAPRGERAATLRALLDERKAESRRLRVLADRAATLEAQILAGAAPPDRPIRQVFRDRTADDVGALARALADRRCTALLAVIEGAAAKVVLAVPGEPHAGRVLQSIAPRFGGRGGGGPHVAQAGGLDPDSVDDLLQALEQALRPTDNT
jgi:alanyl-tRNA synthetase